MNWLKKIPSAIMWGLGALGTAIAFIFMRAHSKTNEPQTEVEIEVDNERKLQERQKQEDRFHDKMDEVEELLTPQEPKKSASFDDAVARWREDDGANGSKSDSDSGVS